MKTFKYHFSLNDCMVKKRDLFQSKLLIGILIFLIILLLILIVTLISMDDGSSKVTNLDDVNVQIIDATPPTGLVTFKIIKNSVDDEFIQGDNEI